MNCPGCGTALRSQEDLGCVFQACEACGGHWFTQDTLPAYLNRRVTQDQSIPYLKPRLAIEAPECVDHLTESVRACPSCQGNMLKLNYAYDSNIFLDRCGPCGGLWVDGEELLPLLQFTKGNPKIDRLANSMAAFAQEREQRLQNAEQWKQAGSPGGWYFLRLPVILPLQDAHTCSRFPVATVALIALNVVIFMAYMLRAPELADFFAAYGFIPAHFWENALYPPLVTSMFLHANVLHLAFNMLFLWIFGDNIEEELGTFRFLLFYFLSGFAGDVLHAAIYPESTVPAIGASGAIAGVLGAYFFLHPSVKIKTFILNGIYQVPAWLYIGFWLAGQLLSAGLSRFSEGEGGVGWFAHLGGFFAGTGIAALLLLKRRLYPASVAAE